MIKLRLTLPLPKKYLQSSLIRNSLSLVFASGATAVFGFLFWIVVARYFDASAVGIAATLLSMSTLISLLGITGFGSIFIRFLAKSSNRNGQINSGLIIAGTVTGAIALAFCLLIPFFSPQLLFVTENIWYIASFTLITMFATWIALTNAALVAYRASSWILRIGIIFGILKISLLFAMSSGDAMTIFIAVGIAQFFNILLNIGVLAKYHNYVPALKIDFKIVRQTLKFGLATYAASALNMLPSALLPIIVISELGASLAAYFYIAFAVASLLYTIVSASNNVLLAEASHSGGDLLAHIRKGLKLGLALLTPAILVVFLGAPLILSLFGQDYKDEAIAILRIMSVGGFIVLACAMLNFIFKQRKNLIALLVMALVNAVIAITLSVFLANDFGLTGIGWAWNMGGIASFVTGMIFLRYTHTKPE